MWAPLIASWLRSRPGWIIPGEQAATDLNRACSVSKLDVIAIIPARGGSRRIPRKNLVSVGGQPLISHTVLHATSARSVGAVYVSTDDEEIADHAKALGAEIVIRPPELASDTATSESALLHVLDT